MAAPGEHDWMCCRGLSVNFAEFCADLSLHSMLTGFVPISFELIKILVSLP